MRDLIIKLNYKGQKKIALVNAEEGFFMSLTEILKDVIIDREIDLRFPYSFIILFVKNVAEVEHLAPKALHNLSADGVLWFCYPKKTSKRLNSDIDRAYGWKILNDSGLKVVRLITIDEDWSAMRFRNIKYIKSSRDKLSK